MTLYILKIQGDATEDRSWRILTVDCWKRPRREKENHAMRVSLIAFIGLAFWSGAAHGKEPCSNATLKGAYGLYATGTVIGVGPVGLVGVLNYDGRGAFTGTVFQKVSGNLVQFTVTGTYSVDSNCVSTDVSLTSTGQSATHTVVIVDNGNEFYSLNTTLSPGNVVVGIGKRQFAADDSGDDR